MRLICPGPGPGHPYTMLHADYSGTLEVRCPRCKRMHLYGPGAAESDVRCPGTFKNSGNGWCGRLAFRISLDATGEYRYTCQNCRVSRTLRIDTPAIAAPQGKLTI